jgi:formate-dependent phosphoribosylglycinamide formyltransferase (GAR transformylase)
MGDNMEASSLQQCCVSMVVPHQLKPIMGSGPKDRKVLKEIDDISNFINYQLI